MLRKPRTLKVRLNFPLMVAGKLKPAGAVVEVTGADYAGLRDRKRGGVPLVEEVK